MKPITSYNLLEIEFSQWRDLWRDLRSARSLRAFVGYLVKPPGWRADGPGETTEELRQRAALPPSPPMPASAASDFVPLSPVSLKELS